MSTSDADDDNVDDKRANTNASATTSRLDLVVPVCGAMLVEFPGYVRNVPAAMQVLGGEQALAAAAEGRAKYLTARLRPGDPLSHPLVSSAVRGEEGKRRGLLLRVSRPAAVSRAQGGGGEDGGEEDAATTTKPTTTTKTTVAAVVSSGVSFPGLADVQYAAWDARPPAEQVGRSLPRGVAVAPPSSSSSTPSTSASASAVSASASAALAVPDPPGSILPGEPLLAVPPVFFASDVAPAVFAPAPASAPASALPAAEKKK